MAAGSRVLAVSLLIAAVLADPAGAAARGDYRVAPGPLSRAIADLARQAGIDIGATDPALAAAHSPGVSGQMSPREALRRLLVGTGFRAVAIDETSFRLVAAPRVVPPLRPRIAPPPETDAEAIVVVASKRTASLLRFPGAVNVIQPSPPGFGFGDVRDMHGVVGTLPILQGTELGNGRNKLFVRGVADSSFVGPTRSTAGSYFDEAQLGYNGADPNLNLYDVGRIEVLEGPQGALYGAGSIGGIVRILPRMPDAGAIAASAMASGAATQHGGLGRSGAAMANLPVVGDLIALRAVGYAEWQAGYIDDARRGLSNINRTRTTGGRIAARITPGDGWTLDLGYVAQQNKAPDTQYALRGTPLRRASAIAQPFEGDFALRQIVVRKDWHNGLHLVGSAAHVRHHSDDRYDATVLARFSPLAYDTHDRNRLTTHELRLSRAVENGNSWLVGFAHIKDNDRIQRELGLPGNPQDIAGVTNRADDLSTFGEGTVALTPRFSITAGSRFTRTSTESDPSFIRAGGSNFVRGVKSARVSPMLAASLLLTPRLAWYTRYGSGFRTGGLAVAPGVGRVANFQPDSIQVIESGLRLQRGGELGLAGMIGISAARWKAIQADLVDRRGFPYTTNIGDGRIHGLEATAEWIPVRGLTVEGALFVADSRLTDPVIQLLPQEGDDLADTPRFAANGRIVRGWEVADGQRVALAATGQYTGRSYVGFGPMLDVVQGDYVTFGATASWQGEVFGVSLDLDNIGDKRGNRFALGNPFGVADRNQITPVRPRTVRLTLSWRAGP